MNKEPRTSLEEIHAGESLSDREIDILYDAAKGLTAAQSGAKRFLSPETIKQHKKMIIAKLEAKNMTHAVVIAIAAGALNINRIVDFE